MTIKLTVEAIGQIKEVMETQGMSLETTSVRVGVRGKSCSGTVYAFGLDDEFDPEMDEISVQDGLKVVHGKQYTSDLGNVTVDFKEVDGKKGFTFSNPLQVLSSGGEGGCCGGGGCGSGGGCNA